jgi:uncharacterized protein YbjT (DUF2867 family)
VTAPFLVTGGTGSLGRRLVPQLTATGHEVRVLSRREHPDEHGARYLVGDLAKNRDIGPALYGVRTVIHCASANKGDAEATGNLVRAATSTALATGAAPPHLVFISIVGVDTLSLGYFKAKLDAERVVTDSGLPWTILRVTQFYDLVLTGARQLARFPVVPVPAGFRTQPIDAAEVATRLVQLALAEPAGRVPDMGGPEITDAVDLIRRYLRATGRRRPVLPLPLPARRVKAGALLPASGDGGPAGLGTWEDFIAEHGRTTKGRKAGRARRRKVSG